MTQFRAYHVTHSQNTNTHINKTGETIPRTSWLHRKFVPCFADISRPLTRLTRKNEEFKWTTECDKCFHMLKEYLQEALILRYPSPEAEYVLCTDASKYAYAGVLTQTINGTDHPVAYTSGLFRGSQLNPQPSPKKHMQSTCL